MAYGMLNHFTTVNWYFSSNYKVLQIYIVLLNLKDQTQKIKRVKEMTCTCIDFFNKMF